MIKLFISYRSLDSAKVDAIVARLKTLTNPDGTPRYQIWQDKTGIRPAQDWWEAIVDAIIDCNVFVFMMSHESVKNTNCRAELNYARRRNRPVLPVVLEGEYVYNSITGKNDVSYGADIPDDLTDLRTQYLFYDGPAALQKFENAVTALQAEARRWIDLEAPRPRDPRDSDVNNSAIALYAEACDYAYRLELATADRLFRRLIAADDPDFYEPARIWVDLLRDYQELLELDARQSTRYAFKSRWERYAAQFPQSFIEGIFDPKGLGERVSDSGEQTAARLAFTPVANDTHIVAPDEFVAGDGYVEVEETVEPGEQRRLPPALLTGASILMVIVLVVGMLASQGTSGLAVVILTLALIYVGLALLVTQINNIIAQVLKLRTMTLVEGLRTLLDDPVVLAKFITHPLIRLLKTPFDPRESEMINTSSSTAFNPVIYISPDRFVDVLTHILVVEVNTESAPSTDAGLLQALKQGVSQVSSVSLREALQSVLYGVDSFREAKIALEMWFNNLMGDLSERYGQQMRTLSLAISLILCVLINIDAIQIGVETFGASTNPEAANLPLGWYFEIPDKSCQSTEEAVVPLASCHDSRNIANLIPAENIFWFQLLLTKLIGWQISAIAISLLAPFLYTILNRLTRF